MKSFAIALTVFFTCFTLFSTTAEARRMGGGSSFGKQRTVQPQRAPDAAPRQATPPAQTAPQQQGNRWLGPLAGLAIGAGLGAMFSNFLGGSGGTVLLAILAALLALFLIRRFARPRQTQTQYQTAQGPTAFKDESVRRPTFDIPVIGSGAAALNQDGVTSTILPDFPVESFLRGAQATFIRLQAANDRKDLDDIREYTTPEVFAEIAMQIRERGDATQKTDVVKLNADLLEAVTEGDFTVASVRFTGEITENGGMPERFDEIWHVQHDTRSPKSGWLLAGIQQTV
jgi:predicted lipid-binding transport protein (Tim44 family)